MIESRPAHFWNPEPDYETIDPDVVPVVQALRVKGIETWASCSNVGPDSWGAYIQVHLQDRVHFDGLLELTHSITPVLQQQVNNQAELSLVSAEAWLSDRNTRDLKGERNIPIYRLQLTGLRQEELNAAWQIVKEAI